MIFINVKYVNHLKFVGRIIVLELEIIFQLVDTIHWYFRWKQSERVFEVREKKY